MSLVRAACRLQAIEALLSDPVLDALVQGRVFDSRISAIDHLEPSPTILVTTEETKGEAWSHQNGGAPFDTDCDLVLEIAMNALAPLLDADGKPVVEGGVPAMAIGYAASDRKLEARLDLLDERAIEILTRGETPAARLLCERVLKRAPEFKAARFNTDQTGERLAVHLVTLRVKLFDPDEDDPLDPPTGPFAALPQPLRSVAEAADPDGSVYDTCLMLAADLAPAQPSAPAVPFAGVDGVLAPQPLDADAPPDRAADMAAGRTVAFAATIPS